MFFHIQKCFGKFALTVHQSKEKKGEREMLVNSIKKNPSAHYRRIFFSFFLLWESSERIYLLPFSSESSEIVRFSCKPHTETRSTVAVSQNTTHCRDTYNAEVGLTSGQLSHVTRVVDLSLLRHVMTARHTWHFIARFFLLPTFFWQCFKLLHPSAWRHFNIRVPCAREVAVCCGARL